MSRPWRLPWIALLASCAVSPSRQADRKRESIFNERLGIADMTEQGDGCLAMGEQSPPLDSGTVLSLAYSGSALYPAALGEARVVARATVACDQRLGVGNWAHSGPLFYRIARTGGAKRGDYAVAVARPAVPFALRSGRPVADLDGDGALEAVRRCTSREGLNFTVWTGSPLEGRLRWHRYVYAGYDMVWDCTDRDGADDSLAIGASLTMSEGREPEPDALALASERSLNVTVNDKPVEYGDPSLRDAVHRLADIPKPWLVPGMIRRFELANADWLRKLAASRAAASPYPWPEADRERQRVQDLATLLIASRDTRAVVSVARTIDDPDTMQAGHAMDALFDYVVQDINYGVPPEQWLGPVAGHGYDFTHPAVRRWWAANRARLEAAVRRRG